MSSPAKAHEPSMEEILASIRRIIADDEAPATGVADVPRDPAPPAVEASAPDDILELTDPVAPPGDSDPRPDVEFRESSPPSRRPPEVVPARAGTDRLLSPAADSIASSAFAELAHTVLAENSRTLEDLVHEMLRPMLKTWLDDNLPALVERLVRQEIEHVSRGGRR